MSGTLSVYGQGDGKLIEEFNMRRENKELRAEVARLTEERDEARAALINIEDESDIYRDALLALIDAVHLYDRGMSTSDALSAALSRARVYAGEVTT